MCEAVTAAFIAFSSGSPRPRYCPQFAQYVFGGRNASNTKTTTITKTTNPKNISPTLGSLGYTGSKDGAPTVGVCWECGVWRRTPLKTPNTNASVRVTLRRNWIAGTLQVTHRTTGHPGFHPHL